MFQSPFPFYLKILFVILQAIIAIRRSVNVYCIELFNTEIVSKRGIKFRNM